MSALTDKPTNTRKITIFCKVGHYLVLKRKGKKIILAGSDSENSAAGQFEIQSFGSSVVRIKNLKYKKYIAMDKKGRVSVTHKRKVQKTLFKENQEDNLFSSYASYRYYKKEKFDMFLGLSNNGRIRSGKITHSGQDGIQFLVNIVKDRVYAHPRRPKDRNH